MRCLDEKTAADFAAGRLPAPVAQDVEAHLSSCPACRLLSAALAKTQRRDRTSQSEIVTEPSHPIPDGEPSYDQTLSGRFKLRRVLGRGAMGVVFEALDRTLGVRVALKVLRSEVGASPAVLRRLHREILTNRRVSHPNVSRVYDLGTDGDVHFITMELVEGETLERLVQRQPLTPPQALAILEQVCSALAAAHREGVVHRDLKPSNVMVHPSGRAVVMDFGLAMDLRSDVNSESVVGTPAYWSPEQARGEPATPASDVYSLGVMGYDIFTGRHYSMASGTDFPEVPQPFRDVLARCLEPLPSRRYPDACALQEALASAREMTLARRRRSPLYRIGAVAGVGMLLGVTTVLLVFGLPRASQAPAPVAPLHEPAAPVAAPVVDRVAPPAEPVAPVPKPAPAVEPPRVEAKPAPPPRLEEPAPAKHVKPAHPGKHEPVKVARADPPPPEISSTPAPAPTPAEPAPDLGDVKKRLLNAEKQRISRRIVLEDVPEWSGFVGAAREGLDTKDGAAGVAAVERLERLLALTHVDETFVQRKLQRLTRLVQSRKLSGSPDVQALTAKVHAAFFAGDFEKANASLTDLQQTLDAIP